MDYRNGCVYIIENETKLIKKLKETDIRCIASYSPFVFFFDPKDIPKFIDFLVKTDDKKLDTRIYILQLIMFQICYDGTIGPNLTQYYQNRFQRISERFNKLSSRQKSQDFHEELVSFPSIFVIDHEIYEETEKYISRVLDRLSPPEVTTQENLSEIRTRLDVIGRNLGELQSHNNNEDSTDVNYVRVENTESRENNNNNVENSELDPDLRRMEQEVERLRSMAADIDELNRDMDESAARRGKEEVVDSDNPRGQIKSREYPEALLMQIPAANETSPESSISNSTIFRDFFQFIFKAYLENEVEILSEKQKNKKTKDKKDEDNFLKKNLDELFFVNVFTLIDVEGEAGLNPEQLPLIKSLITKGYIDDAASIVSRNISDEKILDFLNTLFANLKCPVGLCLIGTPILINSGHTYDRKSLTNEENRWILTECPSTRIPITNYKVNTEVNEFLFELRDALSNVITKAIVEGNLELLEVCLNDLNLSCQDLKLTKESDQKTILKHIYLKQDVKLAILLLQDESFCVNFVTQDEKHFNVFLFLAFRTNNLDLLKDILTSDRVDLNEADYMLALTLSVSKGMISLYEKAKKRLEALHTGIMNINNYQLLIEVAYKNNQKEMLLQLVKELLSHQHDFGKFFEKIFSLIKPQHTGSTELLLKIIEKMDVNDNFFMMIDIALKNKHTQLTLKLVENLTSTNFGRLFTLIKTHHAGNAEMLLGIIKLIPAPQVIPINQMKSFLISLIKVAINGDVVMNVLNFLKTDQTWKAIADNIPVFTAILKATKLQMSALAIASDKAGDSTSLQTLKDSQSEAGKLINFKRKGSLLTLFPSFFEPDSATLKILKEKNLITRDKKITAEIEHFEKENVQDITNLSFGFAN